VATFVILEALLKKLMKDLVSIRIIIGYGRKVERWDTVLPLIFLILLG